MMTIHEHKMTKTQKNNEKKLQKLQAEAERTGKPVPGEIPPTARALAKIKKQRKKRAKLNLSRFVSPDTIKERLAAHPEGMREVIKAARELANKKARNRRRNIRGVKAVPTPMPTSHRKTVHAVQVHFQKKEDK